ncbi:glycoside hydrolase family 2 TIM barrel-domain containing protein [Demequina muriae]|uniref:Glycoside hydrolase family 2 TIM barrel-domain containing protein n=1 Tax=Demequina muriae TaxID=3051664 RepID=A0ABT8GG91_9MICO|nr:glycoside hydrolase family 2 TIM barrel-domain containing protein [Demequina sp. EGI L300058]MDN4480464.1 glycoside hydrolase family 2 TIM barrel-domain containing protein [Demequina sp. EGI L300058]
MPTTTLNDGWAVRDKVSAFAELGGAKAEWVDVTLPHDALFDRPRSEDAPGGAATGYFPSGAFEYRRELVLSNEDRGKLVVLEFDGVYRDAMVYVNGALAGQHAFGYSRFAVRIDPYLRVGEANEIRVTCRAHQDSRWYTGAGIYRDVHLTVKQLVHLAVSSVQVSTLRIDDEAATVEVKAEVANLSNETATVTVASAIRTEGAGVVAQDRSPVTVLPGATAVLRHRVLVEQPALWDVDSPALHTASLTVMHDDIVVDEEEVAFGIRSLDVDSRRGFRLNGQPLKLRGASVHHDNGPLGAVSVRAAEERRVRLLKEAGFNAIRSSHNPASTALLEACDRIGMLVVDEAFDMWTSNKTDFDYASDFSQWWERDLEALVRKDINHPSVIMYSIGNEIPETGTPAGGVWSRRLAEKLRDLDPARPVTNGINGFVSTLDVVIAGMRQAQAQAQSQASPESAGGVNGMMTSVGAMMNQIAASDVVTERTAESFSVLDVAGLNYGDARYEMDKSLFPHRVILGTESFPAQIAAIWELVTANDHVVGDFTWTGWDYLGESGLGSVVYAEGDEPGALSVAQPFPWLTAWCGDIDITGRRRPASYYREIVFGLRTEPYIAVRRPERNGQTPLATPWAWSDVVGSWNWPDRVGETVAVEVYAAADEVELLLNGSSVGRAEVGAEFAFRADFQVAYAPGQLVAVAYAAGTEVGRTDLVSGADRVELELDADRLELDRARRDLAFIDISVTDGEGVAHNGRDREVTVTVTGGDLVALGSAAPATQEGFFGPSRTTFDGRALAIVSPGDADEIQVLVEADGCEPRRLTLRVATNAADAPHAQATFAS